MGFGFATYVPICETTALVVCPLLGPSATGLEASCYARNVEINGTIIFQPATCFVHIAALIMVLIMVLHIRSKYTAIGRKEIVLFFYIYAVQELLSIFLDSAIIPTSSTAYPWFAAVNTGLISSMCWCLLVSGFVGFQIIEDGTPLSLWFLRLSSLAIWFVVAFISMATFKNVAGFDPSTGVALWITQYIFNTLCLIIYVVLQLILVVRTLDDRWPIGDILFGCAFFAVGQALLYGFNTTVCSAVKHYLDALFFSTMCSLFAVMMVYKYWDSITKEDLEFSVGSKQAVWDISLKDGINDNNSGYGNAPNHSSVYGYPPQKGTYEY